VAGVIKKYLQVFKRALLQFWNWRVPVIAASILLTVLLCAVQYVGNIRTSAALMTLNYSEASRGLNPNRTRFTTTDLTSDEVLQNTIKSAGLEGQLTVEKLRSWITVEPTDVTNVSSSENYITTSYNIRLTMDESYPHLKADTLLEIYCGSYKDYFMEHYGENQSIFSNQMPEYFETEPYLQLKNLTLRADQMDRYLTTRVSENKSYMDATTGSTFLSLSKQVQNVINYEIPRIQAFILRGSVTTHSLALTSMLQYKIQIEQLEYQKQMAYYTSDNIGISRYDETMSAIVMIPTLDENSQFYMSRTKTALDDMASDADGSLAEASSHQDVITSTQYVVEQMQQLTDYASLSQAKAMLNSLEKTLDEIQQALRVTDASYIIYKTQNYLVFNYNADSFIQQIELKKVLVMVAAFVAACFAACCLNTRRRTRRKERRR